MCGGCSDCQFVNAPKTKLFYEIHITVEDPRDDFEEYCEAHGFKGIVVANYNVVDVIVGTDVMTSYKVPQGVDPFRELLRLEQMISATYKILRSKIETVPWHPLAGGNGYFEAHISVNGEVPPINGLSKSVRVKEGLLWKYATMFTYRRSGVDYETFREALREVEKSLHTQEYFIDEKVITEYALYDTNVDHDKEWINDY